MKLLEEILIIPKKGNEAAYCRYLRYNVEGWYQFDSSEVLRRWQKVRNIMIEKIGRPAMLEQLKQ